MSMTPETATLIKRTLGDVDVIGVIPVPLQGDRMHRLRALGEALADFDRQGSHEGPLMGYFVQVKPRKPTPRDPMGAVRREHNDVENIYKADGKLNAGFLFRSAETLYSAGDYALARNIYKSIIQSGENKGSALLGMGRCYEAEGKLEEARLNYEDSIAYYPQAETYKLLTALLIRQRKDQAAAEVIERALHHRDMDIAARYDFTKTAGNCWSRANNPKEAERYYKKALELRPDADEIRANLGALCLQNGKIQDAERHFQDAIASNPNNAQALMGLGTCALSEGNQFGAHAWFARSLQIDLKNPTALFHLIKCAYAIKNYSIAARLLEDYMQIAPVNTHILYSLAGLQFHLGRYEDASATCFKVLHLEQEHHGAKELLTRIQKTASGRS